MAVVAEAGGEARDVGRLTWFVLDIAEYRAALAELGPAYRDIMGGHYPAMSLVQAGALVEAEARLKIEATAVVAG